MARITVEDCLKNVDNRFELVLLASKRARQLVKEGAEPLVPAEGDKVTVIALREIALGVINKSILEESKVPTKIVATAPDTSEISQEIVAETQQTDVDSEFAADLISEEDLGLESDEQAQRDSQEVQ